MVWGSDGVRITVAPTDHRPVAPTIGFRIEHDGASVVLAGDTVPCASLDELAVGAGALVHTVIRKDLVELLPQQRIRDICDYHSSVEQAAATAARAGVGILILTHYVPAIAPGQEDDWRALAADHFDRQIELGDDLHRVEVHPGVGTRPAGVAARTFITVRPLAGFSSGNQRSRTCLVVRSYRPDQPPIHAWTRAWLCPSMVSPIVASRFGCR